MKLIETRTIFESVRNALSINWCSIKFSSNFCVPWALSFVPTSSDQKKIISIKQTRPSESSEEWERKQINFRNCIVTQMTYHLRKYLMIKLSRLNHWVCEWSVELVWLATNRPTNTKLDFVYANYWIATATMMLTAMTLSYLNRAHSIDYHRQMPLNQHKMNQHMENVYYYPFVDSSLVMFLLMPWLPLMLIYVISVHICFVTANRTAQNRHR